MSAPPVTAEAKPAPSLRARGRLALELALDEQRARTECRIVDQAWPLRVVRAFPHGERAALVHLQNVAGGVLSGDVLTTRVAVGPGAHAVLTTTGANRLYRRRAGDPPASQELVATVAAGGRLEHLPDQTIPFAGSAARQVTRLSLARGAALLHWDVVASGREAAAESFAYDSLAADVAIDVEGETILRERWRLEPRAVDPRAAARLAGRTHFGSLYACDAGAPPSVWLELEAAAHELLARSGVPAFGASALPRCGLAVRIVDCSAEPIMLAFRRLRDLVKSTLWGGTDPMPRKIY